MTCDIDTDALTHYQLAAHKFLTKNRYTLNPTAITELGAMLGLAFQSGYSAGKQSPRTFTTGILVGISILLGTTAFGLWLVDAHLQMKPNHVVVHEPCALYAGIFENCLVRVRP